MKRFKALQACLAFMMLILSVFLISGCGSNGQTGHWLPGESENVPIGTAPTVTAVVPLNNAVDVAINTKKITAAFSEPMDPTTLTTASFKLACGGTPVTGGGPVTYVAAGNVATLPLPAATNLPPSTVCTATITTGAKDLDGDALASNFVWTFTTGVTPDTTRPTVTAVVPLNNATGVAINTKKITAAFSEPMDPTTLTTASFKLACPAGTPVTGGGAVTYQIAGNVATLPLPEATNLPDNTLCTATITTGAEDLAGNSLAVNFVWTFRTGVTPDTTRPRVISTLPVTTNPGPTTGVLTNTAITATFNEDMAPLTITAASFTLTGPGLTPVAGAVPAVTYAVGSRKAIFWPAAALLPSTTYTATITTAAADLAGNALASNYVWTFTTAAAPVPPAHISVSSIYPEADADDVCPSATISATFVVPSGSQMNLGTITATTFIVTGPGPSTPLAVVAGTYALDGTGLIATFTPLSPLAVGTYTVTIKGGVSGVKDLAIPTANTMENDYRVPAWTFTVVDCLEGPDLGAASTFAIAATAGVTNTPAAPPAIFTHIEGDVVLVSTVTCNGVFVPGGAGTAGFGACTLPPDVPPTLVGTVVTPTVPDTTTATNVMNALTAAFLSTCAPGVPSAACSLTGGIVLSASSAGLGGGIGDPCTYNINGANCFTPGVYTAGTSIGITGDLTLDGQGNPNAVFIFQAGSTLDLAAGAAPPAVHTRIRLINQAKASNVFWSVGSTATLGLYSELQGNILAYTTIVMKTGATSCGRLLAGASGAGQFTFDNNVVSVPGQPFAPPATYSVICE